MKMKKRELKNKIKQLVVELGNNLLGNDGERLINYLYGKKEVNEFLIAKRLDLNINYVRNLLYKLANRNIVSSIRRKDKKRGWYIYFWTLSSEKSILELKKIKLKRIEEIKNEIKSKTSTTFYTCKNRCLLMKESTALLHDFFCPECGELTMPVSLTNVVKKLEKEKTQLIKDIEEIENLLRIIRTEKIEKRGKKKGRKVGKRKKEPKKKRGVTVKPKKIKKVKGKVKKKMVKKQKIKVKKGKMIKKKSAKRKQERKNGKKGKRRVIKSERKKKKRLQKKEKKKTKKVKRKGIFKLFKK